MIVREYYKQNETYVIDKKLEDVGVFFERVDKINNNVIKEYNAKIIDISYIRCLDNNLMCIVAYELDATNYNKYYDVD